MKFQLPRLLLFDVPMHLSNQLSGRFLAKIHCQHGATHEKNNTYLCHTWEIGHGMGQVLNILSRDQGCWKTQMIGIGHTHSRTSILSCTRHLFHTRAYAHTCEYIECFFRCSLNRVFMRFEIMLKADRAIQSLAPSSGQHFSLSVLLKLWLCHFLLFVQKSST